MSKFTFNEGGIIVGDPFPLPRELVWGTLFLMGDFSLLLADLSLGGDLDLSLFLGDIPLRP